MSESRHKIAEHDQLAQGKTLCVDVEGRELLLCHINEGYFVVDNQCSHAAARLCEGKLKGQRILCPLHGAAFDVRDGAPLSRPASKPIASFPLEVSEEGIFVLLPAGDG